MRKDKVGRLFYILNYLNNHDTVTASELANHLGISKRSIYRDMKILEDYGVQYITEGKNGYRLIHNKLNSLRNLTSEEWMAIVLYPFISNDITANDHPLNFVYRSGIEKIGATLKNKNKLIPLSSQLGERILFQDRYRQKNDPKIMSILVEAIVSNYTVQISYYSIYRDKTTDRCIDPYYLVPRGGNLYIIAYCHYRKDVRIFRINRIKEIKLTNKSFNMLKDFNITEYFENRWSIFADEDEPILFIVRFNKDVARFIYEYDFNTNVELNEQDNGDLILKTRVKSKEEFLRWIRSFGANVEVIEPITVRKELKQEYESLADKYKN